MDIGINLHHIAPREVGGESPAPGAEKVHRRKTSGAESEKLTEAAQEFEALLLAQVLKAARQPGEGGWLSSGSDQASNTALEMAESQLARVLASRGVLGIDKVMAGHLEHGSKLGSETAVPGPAAGRDSQ